MKSNSNDPSSAGRTLFGFAEAVITPGLGLNIPGYFDPRPASGIKDELMARAFIAESSDAVIAAVVLDLLGIPKELCDAVRERVSRFTAIPKENIMVAGTHTHTGAPTTKDGLTGDNFNTKAEVEAAIDHMATRAADAVILAYRRRSEAVAGWGIGREEGIAFNRRYLMKDGSIRTNPGMLNPNIVRSMGVIDPDVTVLRVDNPGGTPLGIVVNYACHADVVEGDEYSADYIGELSRAIKRSLGSDVVTVFMNGCCGDINHIDFTGNVDTTSPQRYIEMGRILAGVALATRERIKTADNMKLDVMSGTVKIARRQPTAEQIEWSRKVISGEDDSAVVDLNEKNDDAGVEFIAASNTRVVDLSYARGMLSLVENPVPHAEIEVQTFRIGDTGIVALPAEVFVEIGLDIKAKSPFDKTVICELANDLHGYVGTELAHEQGSYEVRLSDYTYLSAEAAKILTDEAFAQLDKLANGGR